MIDLHIHTNSKDGKNNLEEILNICQCKKLKIISITDQNTCKPHIDLKKMNHNFTGIIKTGAEVITCYNGHKITLLAYDFQNIEEIENFLKLYNLEEINLKIKEEFIDKISKLNYKYNEKIKQNIALDKQFEKSIYESIINSNEDIKGKLQEQYIEVDNFYIEGIYNPNSIFYIDITKYYPKIEEIINIIHKNEGKLFLAYPYSYKVKNILEFIDELFFDYEIDGLQSYHSNLKMSQIKELKEIANLKMLLETGGSDYYIKKNQEIGIVSIEGYQLCEDITENWNKKSNAFLI